MRVSFRNPGRLALACLISALLLAAGTAEAKRGKKKSQAEQPPAKAGKSLTEVTDGTDKIEGLLTFYRSPDKLFMELPADLEGAPLGFAAVMVHAAGDFVVRGAAADNQLVRWDRVGDHLMLRKENLEFRADPDSPMHAVIQATFPDSPAFAAPLVQLTDDPEPLLIDAKKLFGPDLSELMSRSGYTARPDDAVLVSVKAFEDNVVARVTYRFRRKEGRGQSEGGSPFMRFLRPGRLADPRSAEITVDYNFFRLPDDGFQPRFEDERIGGMTRTYKDYSDIDGSDTMFRHLLTRWDLRKQDPDADVSPPVDPITFYMDRSVPEQWRELVREGAEWWNPAFEAVGFRNAVQVLDPPDDPDWDPADLGHSVIYWNLSDNLVFSGMAGPSFSDPRTGEALKANVYLNGEFFSFALHRYLVYAWWRAPDPAGTEQMLAARRDLQRAMRENPSMCNREASFSSQIAFARLVLMSRGEIEPGDSMADEFARQAFLELVSHEVGHALGFPHNWKASLVSSWDDVKSGKVSGRVADNIFATSVMDYNPIYLAPKGMSQGDYFMRELGPYDYLAVEYVYRPLDGMSPEQQDKTLKTIASRAEIEPGLIYDGGELNAIDPTTNSDDYGDDPLAFAEWRLQTLHDEVLPRLDELVLAEGHDYNLLRQALDSAVFSVAMDYIDMTARHVGGQILLRRVAGSPVSGGPPPITPIPATDQRRALDVLDRYLFAEGLFELSPTFMARLKADLQYDWNYPWRYASDYDVGNRVAGLYDAALATLLDPARLRRVLDNERRVAVGEERFTLPELFARLERTAFDTPDETHLSADRRALQRLLVERLSRLVLEPAAGTPAEASQLAALSLRSIRDRTAAALDAGEPDGYTEAHLLDIGTKAVRTLEAGIEIPVSSTR